MRFLYALVLFSSLHLPVQAKEHPKLDPLWSGAISALKEQNNVQAADLFSKWIAAAHEEGVQSPEAYYNLALAEWSLNDSGKAIQNFLSSSLLISSPLQNMRNLALLTELEKQIGIKESAVNTWAFRAMVLLNENFSLLLFSIGFWSFVGLCFWRWIRREGNLTLVWTKVGLIFPLICFLISGSGYLTRRFGADFAVLAEKEQIAVFQQSDAQNKLVDLPPGTIVQLGKKETAYQQIVEPITGWISIEDFRQIRFPEPLGPSLALLRN